MSKRRPGADLGTQIADVREGGKQVGVGGGAGRGPRGDGDPRVGTGKGPGINGPGGTETAGGPQGREGADRSHHGRRQADVRRLEPDARRRARRRSRARTWPASSAATRSYLKKDASARGKVTLSLTVNETGRTVAGQREGLRERGRRLHRRPDGRAGASRSRRTRTARPPRRASRSRSSSFRTDPWLAVSSGSPGSPGPASRRSRPRSAAQLAARRRRRAARR